MEDLAKRITEYEAVYEPLTEDHLSYIQVINLRSKLICNNIHGRLPQMVPQIIRLHLFPSF